MISRRYLIWLLLAGGLTLPQSLAYAEDGDGGGDDGGGDDGGGDDGGGDDGGDDGGGGAMTRQGRRSGPGPESRQEQPRRHTEGNTCHCPQETQG